MSTVSVVSPDPSVDLTLLPARPTLHAGQALDCYLEHAADANHLPPIAVMRAVTDASDTTRYLRLIMTSHAPRRRLSRLLDAAHPLTESTELIPQVQPRELYEEHLTGLFTSRPETIQLFASMTMARTHPGITTWAHAARALGLPPDLGRRCAAAAAASQTASPMTVLSAVSAAARDLARRDYRAMEGRVRALASSDSWFSAWAHNYRPGTRTSSQSLAVQWLWVNEISAHPGTAPQADPARSRRFATTLNVEQQQALRRILDEPTPPRHPEDT